MTHYHDAWIAALAHRDSVMLQLTLMAVSVIAAWVFYTDFIRPRVRALTPLLAAWLPRLLMAGGLSLYWLTVGLYALQ